MDIPEPGRVGWREVRAVPRESGPATLVKEKYAPLPLLWGIIVSPPPQVVGVHRGLRAIFSPPHKLIIKIEVTEVKLKGRRGEVEKGTNVIFKMDRKVDKVYWGVEGDTPPSH